MAVLRRQNKKRTRASKLTLRPTWWEPHIPVGLDWIPDGGPTLSCTDPVCGENFFLFWSFKLSYHFRTKPKRIHKGCLHESFLLRCSVEARPGGCLPLGAAHRLLAQSEGCAGRAAHRRPVPTHVNHYVAH